MGRKETDCSSITNTNPGIRLVKDGLDRRGTSQLGSHRRDDDVMYRKGTISPTRSSLDCVYDESNGRFMYRRLTSIKSQSICARHERIASCRPSAGTYLPSCSIIVLIGQANRKRSRPTFNAEPHFTSSLQLPK
jgi:hypothetical protein